MSKIFRKKEYWWYAYVYSQGWLAAGKCSFVLFLLFPFVLLLLNGTSISHSMYIVIKNENSLFE